MLLKFLMLLKVLVLPKSLDVAGVPLLPEVSPGRLAVPNWSRKLAPKPARAIVWEPAPETYPERALM